MLLFDEMKVNGGLVFSRSSGKLIDFTELGKFSTSDLFCYIVFS